MGHSYKELEVWQLAVEFVTHIYRATQAFPREEMYGLTKQLRRAAVSVPSNIAEGQGRLTRNDFRHFLSQARGSLFEVETQLVIARNLGYLQEDDLSFLLSTSTRVRQMLLRLMEAIAADRKAQTAGIQ